MNEVGTTTEGDPRAARVHRRNAERHYEAAERLRRLGMSEGQQAALAAAEHEDRLADRLEGRVR